MMTDSTKIQIESLDFYYGNRRVLTNINACFYENTINAITGPSGQGKSSLLATINRLWENIPGAKATGRVTIKCNDRVYDINKKELPVTELRRKAGMVFQIPNPLPTSIYKNIAFPLKIAGYTPASDMPAKIETALKQAFLWDEVKDRLTEDARKLSGGQQQRLCIARALVLKPEILLLDEPASSLDAKAAAVIEDLMITLKKECTLIVVSHYLDQINKVADTVMALSSEDKKPTQDEKTP